MADIDKTMQFNFDKELENPVRGIIRIVSCLLYTSGTSRLISLTP